MRAMGVGAEHIEMISKQKGAIPPSDAPICSHLGLQMLIYYHLWFDCVWFSMHVALWMWKSDGNMEYDHAFRMISPTVLALWTITEPPRLLFGYIGNLKEKVPQLASFVLVTLILSAPCAAYFLFFDQNKLTLDWALHAIQFAYTFAELLLGRHALSLLIQAQRDRFAVQTHSERISISSNATEKQP